MSNNITLKLKYKEFVVINMGQLKQQLNFVNVEGLYIDGDKDMMGA